LVQVGMGVYTS